MGIDEALLNALYHIDQYEHLFTDRELVALRYAELVTTSARDVSEELYDQLQSQFDDGEIVELTTVIGMFNFFNRFADALKLDER
jgi:alkylhydroperoxidase family enzyme